MSQNYWRGRLKPVKCSSCGKRLFDAISAEVDIKCKCGTLNQVRIYSQDMLTNGLNPRIIRLKLKEAVES